MSATSWGDISAMNITNIVRKGISYEIDRPHGVWGAPSRPAQPRHKGQHNAGWTKVGLVLSFRG